MRWTVPEAVRWGLWLALAAGALAGCGASESPGASGTRVVSRAPAAAPADPAAGLDLVTANRMAIAFLESGHSLEGLPYFRRQMAVAPQDVWSLHQDYANALHNAALEPREARGLVIQAARANDDRIALMTESMQQFEIAEHMARPPRDRATVRWALGHKFETWGMPWDARAQYRLALVDDPGFEAVRRQAGALERVMREASGAPR